MKNEFDQEEWRAVAGYPGYEVSNMGNVRSYRKTGLGGLRDTPKPVKPMDSRGYLAVNLWNRGKLKTKKIHRLVCESFIGPSELPVNHINGNPSDNRLCNLEYVTTTENAIHAKRVLGKGRGTRVSTVKLTERDVMAITQRCASGENAESVAKDYNVAMSTVNRIARGDSWGWLTGAQYADRRKGTKLLKSDVIKICERIASGEPHRVIAGDFSVSKSSVDRISSGDAWGWMPEVQALRQRKANEPEAVPA
jgi:hypothetical protein